MPRYLVLSLLTALAAADGMAQTVDLLQQSLPPANQQLEEQLKGNFGRMDLRQPLGAIQKVFDSSDPQDSVLTVREPTKGAAKVRLREGMATTFFLPPNDELITYNLGDPVNFDAKPCDGDSGCIHVWPKAVGVDTSLTLVGKNRTGYAFYLRSESIQSGNIPHVKVVLAQSGPKIERVSRPEPVEQKKLERPMDGKDAEEWVQDDTFDPATIRHDREMRGDKEIAPIGVWRDNRMTWLDYGGSTEPNDWPAVWRVVDGIDEPVRIRKTKDNRFLVVEAIGPLTLRRGEKVVCIVPKGN